MVPATAAIYEVMTTSPSVLATSRVPLYRFFGPRFWAIWLGLGLIRAMNVLPLRAQLAVGRALGRLAYRFARRDRRIALINIRMCLPGLSDTESEELVREHFESLGCTLLETGLVWWASDERLRSLIQFEGEEHLRAALAKGRGALMLSAHFTTLEMGARALTLLVRRCGGGHAPLPRAD
jgi:KDO2-lipid IV(A) lauroyltransferase